MITPAFWNAIASSVPPSWAVWSSPTDVTTDTIGRQTFVLSYRPPSPTSTTATSHRRSAKWRNPTAVPISKNVVGGHGPPSSARTAGATSAILAASSAREIGSPSTRVRSSTRSRCGDVNSPTW